MLKKLLIAAAIGGRPWVIWQYADNVRMPGIEGPVDQNALRGTIRDLLESTWVGPAR
jgi:GH25 family lysozyme M1 (1,4-beta-N-acetylmuramidase)